MAEQSGELKEERARLERELERIRAAIENLSKQPEEFAFELSKAHKDEGTVRALIQEIDDKLAAAPAGEGP
ncbi:MAG TPA: hypothetical protein VF586_15855 [Pyrinomonadaceae bacterium]|jgi:predicted RNase H-like nuclease (RuvC/YqgF family)